MDIKNTLDLIDVIQDILVAYKASMADGKLDWKDLLNPETRELVPSIHEALKDGSLIPAELSDLDSAEVALIYEKLRGLTFEMLKTFL